MRKRTGSRKQELCKTNPWRRSAARFETGYTTSRAEGLNTKARLATRQAYGFHSADALRAMIKLRCTGISIALPHR